MSLTSLATDLMKIPSKQPGIYANRFRLHSNPTAIADINVLDINAVEIENPTTLTEARLGLGGGNRNALPAALGSTTEATICPLCRGPIGGPFYGIHEEIWGDFFFGTGPRRPIYFNTSNLHD
jgi:hypothetical protein